MLAPPRPSPHRGGKLLGVAWTVLIVLALGAAPGAALAASSPPPSLGENVPGLLLAFSSNTLQPGGTGTLTVTLSDPASAELNASIEDASLELQVYRFAYEGQSQNLTQGDAWATSLSVNGGPASFSVNTTLPTVPLGESTTLAVTVNVPSSATAGSYFVRDRLNFTSGGVAYITASRGFFSDSLWSQATLSCTASGACTPIFNATLLGVSGVSPETSISVSSPWTAVILGGVLAAAAGLAIAAGYVAFRRRGRPVRDGGSRSGARPSPRRKKAATALGNKRTNDGD